uniref:Uncharacterized protein n=1 Tax=Trichogramma kaykai TaxID=54128 RepID=A0ABD2W781_9HYME
MRASHFQHLLNYISEEPNRLNAPTRKLCSANFSCRVLSDKLPLLLASTLKHTLWKRIRDWLCTHLCAACYIYYR